MVLKYMHFNKNFNANFDLIFDVYQKLHMN